jgi:hypothetical protein
LTGEGVRETSRGKVIELGGSKVVELPGNSKLAPIIPSLDYNALVQVLKEQQEELRNDLPELRYYDITTRSHVSGTAMRLALADAIDRVTEARGMMFGALVRANAMALTVGQRWNLPGFASNQIGTYEQGDFEHSFVRPTVIDLSPQEEAQAWGTYTQAGLPPRTTGRRLGWPEEDQDQLDQDRLAEVEFQIALKQKQQDAELDAAKRAEQAKAEVQEEQQARLLERQKQIAQEERDDQERRGDQQAEKQVERSVRQQRALKELDLEFEAKKQKILGQDQGQDQGQGQGVSGNGKGLA